MRVATVDGLVTLFYDRSKVFNYDLHEEWTAEQARIDYDNDPELFECWDISEELITISGFAFFRCYGLVHIKWSIYLRRIEECSFHECDLSSGFMPPTCRYIGNYAFRYNSNLNIFKMPEEVQLGGDGVLVHTALMKKSPHFNIFQRGYGQIFQNWVRNLDREEEFSLHRACCSYRPLKEIIMGIVEERGLAAFSQKNKAGITPSKYLSENPYADISEMEIVRNYISKMMGELE